MEIILRPELLGDCRKGDDGTIEVISAKAFKTACFAAANAVGGKVSEVRVPDVTPNFYVAHIAEKQASTAVLGHRVEPYVAFAPPIDAIAMSTEFIDHDGLARAFRDYTDFTPLSTVTLNRSLTDADIAELREPTRRELRFWGANTLGKAMFNWFD